MTTAFAAGNREAGYRWLAKACDERCFEMLTLKVNPRVRGDQRRPAVCGRGRRSGWASGPFVPSAVERLPLSAGESAGPCRYCAVRAGRGDASPSVRRSAHLMASRYIKAVSRLSHVAVSCANDE